MQALLQSVDAVVVALAATAFAHFGVTLKEPACLQHSAAHVVRKVSVSTREMAEIAGVQHRRNPCPATITAKPNLQTT